MTSARATLCCLVMLALRAASIAQMQTGASAGIPIPAAPATLGPGNGATDTPKGLHFRVRVLDGRNGAPIQGAHVKLWYNEAAGSGYGFASDPEGYGNMPAPVGQPVRVLANVTDYTDCRKSLRGDPPTGYNLQRIAATGMAASNSCGPVAVRTSPGELVLFVRPARWYEGFNHNDGI